MNSDLSDIATNGLTNAVTKDGQTTITGAFKGANGSVGLPMYSFASDTNTGMYRIAADNVGISVGGTKILDIAAGGLTSLYLVQPAGTALLPTYTFSGDLNSGMYSIGADNIGVAIAGAKVLDISATGLNVVGSVSSNGAAFSPTAQGAGLVNGTIVESHTGNAVTFAIKTLAGADPSATDIVYFVFRNVTAATGNYVVLQVTAALSLTVSSGSTLGCVNSTAFRLWLVAFNDASTVRLGVINCVSGTSVYPLGQFPIASSTAEGGAGGADSAQVLYTGSAVSSKAYEIIGYASYESGLGTVGNWASSPTRLQLFGSGVPLPGQVLQRQRTATGAYATGTTTIPHDDTIPQNTEGDQYLSQAITPTSAANLLQIDAFLVYSNSGSGFSAMTLFQDAVASALATAPCTPATTTVVSLPLKYTALAALTTATTFKVRAGSSAAGTTYINGDNATAGRTYGGTDASFIEVSETMT